MTKWLDCVYIDSDDRKQYSRAHFADGAITGISGTVYNLNGFIAKGGNGSVFRCYIDNNEEFAVKFLRVLDKQRRERFEFESLVLSDLVHPGVLRLYDSGLVSAVIQNTREISPVPFIIMDLFQTNIENEIMNGKRFSIEEIKFFGKQICESFEYLHALGIIHRDIKPGNFLIDWRTKRIVISDFGLAKTYTESGADRFWRSDMTAQDERIGSIPWMSTELHDYTLNKTVLVDHRSDIFSLGRVLWFMHTGDIGGIADIEDDQSGGKLYSLLQKSTQKRAAKRFQTIKEMSAALDELC